MSPDSGLLKALVDKLTNHKKSIPLFRIAERKPDEVDHSVVQLGMRFAEIAGFGEIRYSVRHERDCSTFLFQEDIRARLFHASGAIALDRGWRPMDRIIATDARRADLKLLQRHAEQAVKRLQLAPIGAGEQLRFERLWRLKAAGVTRDGKTGPIALTRVVGAFRRYLGDMPVWGRASASVELAAESEVAAASVDWRPVVDEPFDTATVLSPKEGAARILAELQISLPDARYTQKDYTPDSFSLGYFSLPRRCAQTVMQPVYVAMFKPVQPFPSIGRFIVVPAAPHPYELIGRRAEPPPLTSRNPAMAGSSARRNVGHRTRGENQPRKS